MEQALQKARQEKQAYICNNIDPNLYDEFHDFCNSYAGQIDIDNWPIVYVHQLVAKFKQEYIKKNQQQDQHERSFAVYQTTSGDNQITGSATLDMNQILQSLEVSEKVPTKVETSPAHNTSNKNHQSPIQNESSPKPFSKKQPQTIPATVTPPNNNRQKSGSNNKQKSGQSKTSALDLLDSVFQKIGGAEKSKIEENAQKMNKSFFDSVNFWQVPKIDETNKNKVEVSPNSPNKQFKSVKLNLNVNELTKNGNSGNNKKVQEPQPNKNRGSQIQTFSYNNENTAQNYFKTGTISPPVSSPTYNKSQFDTFSMLAQQQIKKKRSNTVAVNLDKNEDEARKKSSTIILKEVKQLKTSPVASSKISSFKQQYKGPKVFKTDFIDHVFCVKSTSRANLANDNLAIQIKNFDIVERSIFSSNYLMYNMKVLPAGTICKRNYEDFTKFKATLQKFYPGIQMPYFEKQGWRVETSEQYARKQIQAIQFFMADILRNPELRNSRVTEQFLSIKDHKTMKRKFEQYDKMTKLKSIQELCLLNGKVQITLTENQRIYNENMGKLVAKFENNLEKYRKNCEYLTNYYNQAMSTMLTIDDIFKDMQKDVEQFNRIVAVKEIQNLEASIKKVRDHYKQSYFRTKFQKSVIEQNILPFIRYEKENTRTSKDILELCNSLTSRYLKRMESQTNHNLDNSYLSATYNEFKQSITEQSKSILVLKYQAGYLQAQASSELQRIMTSLGIKMDDIWKTIAAKYLDQLAKSVNQWSQLS